METTSRTCRWVCRRLPLHVGGELVGVDRRRVERHLITCVGCRSEQTALAQSLAVLQEVAGAHLKRTPDGPLVEAPSVWPALARQIREAKHEASRTRSGGVGVARLVSSGLAASLILGLTWLWSTGAIGSRSLAWVESRPALNPPGTAPVASAPSLTVPVGTDPDSPPTLIALDKLAVPPTAGEVRGSALPTGEELRTLVPARPGFDPFQPPLTLRLDYDLDRGVLSHPAIRDTQRAY